MITSLIAGIAAQALTGAVSQAVGNVLGSLVSNHGSQNVLGALVNLATSALGNALKGAINDSSMPQFLKDAATSLVDQILGEEKQPTTCECQQDVDDAYAEAFNNAATSTAEEASEEANGESAGNWLVALAGSLSKVQAKFLNAAMENMKTMETNGDAAVSGEDAESKETQRNDFLEAQSQYQANMQMFNMVANMTSTSLKSLGEGLTALARKQ